MVAHKITPQFLLSKLKRKLGAKSIKLSYTDEELLEILYDDTIPTFSIYFPMRIPMKVDLDTCKPAKEFTENESQLAYHLDFLPDNMNLIEVESIDFYNETIGRYYDYPTGTMDSFELFTAQVNQGMVEDMLNTPITHYTLEPDILVIDQPFSLNTKIVTLNLLVEHSHDLSTIKFTYLDKIMELFTLDCKIALYEDMKHHDGIDTTFNQIELKIDTWADAESKREDLMQRWDNQFLSHRRKTIFRV